MEWEWLIKVKAEKFRQIKKKENRIEEENERIEKLKNQDGFEWSVFPPDLLGRVVVEKGFGIGDAWGFSLELKKVGRRRL